LVDILVDSSLAHCMGHGGKCMPEKREPLHFRETTERHTEDIDMGICSPVAPSP
jgi:hypothetical protein